MKTGNEAQNMKFLMFHEIKAVFPVLILCLAGLVSSCGKSDPAKPNILLIVLDAARADAFSCYGYHRLTTPNLDTLAAGGLRFTRAVSSSSWTLPSHASLFTGLSPYEHGTYHQHGYFVDHLETLAELLKADGYLTAAFSNNPVVSSAGNMDQGFDLFEDIWQYKNPAKPDGQMNSAYINHRIKKFVSAVKDEENPFFIFINYMDTHDPYYPPEPYVSMFYEPADSMTRNILDAIFNSMRVNAGKISVSEQEYTMIRKLYDGALRYADRMVDDLLDYLDEEGLKDNTLIIITSDHGEVFGRWELFTHNSLLYRPLIHVPLLMAHPKLIKTPRVVDQVVSLENIFHTIVNLRGISHSDTTGLPVRNLLDETIAPGPAFSMFKPSSSNQRVNRYKNDGWSLWTEKNEHYIWFEKEVWEYFDLNGDFAENTNLSPQIISTDSIETLIVSIRDSLHEFQETEADLVITRDVRADDNQRMEVLKSLGYLGDTGEEKDAGELHPHAREHVSNGRYLITRREFKEAAEQIKIALDMEPDNLEIRKDLSAALLLASDFDRLTTVLSPVYGDIGKDTAKLLAMGFLTMRGKEHEKAFKLFVNAVQRDKTIPEIRFPPIRAALTMDNIGFSSNQALVLLDNFDLSEKKLIELASLFIEYGYCSEITDIFLTSLEYNLDPEELAVGYALCNVGNNANGMVKLMPAMEQAGITSDDIDRLKEPLIEALAEFEAEAEDPD